MKHTRKIIVGVAVVPTVIIALAIAALSWVGPQMEVETAGCVGGDRTTPATVTLINKEVGNYGSPAHPKVMSVFPNFTYTQFSPEVLPNTGNTSATMTIDVPADFQGEVKVDWELHWYGTDGSDSTSGKAVINIVKCVPPTTTTIITTTSTSTTSTSTTSTTQPTTSTTSTTQPTTSTTSTTQPSTTTTSTTQPTTSTTSTTQPSTTSTSTTQPSTTTTTPCEPPATSVPDAPTVCLVPPVTIERPSEPAAPVPASPKFTG